jgi:Phage integrase family.
MRENVDLNNGYIDILRSKGLKDRRIFLPEDLLSLYIKYDAIINDIFPGRTYFFPVKSNNCYCGRSIQLNFNIIWEAACLGNGTGTKASAYAFRHHFAFSNLNRWIESGTDVNSMLPYLMRYMGHSSLEGTFYYLHLVPEFFATFSEKTRKFEKFLPEVDYGDEE